MVNSKEEIKAVVIENDVEPWRILNNYSSAVDVFDQSKLPINH